MVLWLRKCASVYTATYARSSLVDLCKTCFLLPSVRQSSAGYETKHKQQHLPTSKKQQERLVRRRPQQDEGQRLLKAAIIGAPNAGKSTLLNKLIGWKVAPVSQKVHTTRYKTLGVLTEDEKQVVFLDTPGIIVPGKLKRHKLEQSLLVDPHMAMFNADIVIVLVDVSHIWHQSRLDPEILKLLQLHASTPSVLVLNKIDLVKKKQKLLSIVKKLTDGVVAKNVSWSTVKAPRDVADILHKKRQESKHADTVTSTHGLYNLQESCDVLQSSYDDLYDDDDGDESGSVDTSISNNDGYELSCRPNSNTAVNEDTDDGAVLDSDMDSSVDDCSDRFAVHSSVDLYSPDVWDSYYTRLQAIGRSMKDREGWPNFDAVFMISAIDGDGIIDMKKYLLDRAYLSGWEYTSSVVTDQNPVKLAKLIIQERLLDHLPDEIPYSIQVRLSLWTIENDYLRASFDIVCSQNRQMRQVLRHIRAVAAEAKQELMNTFRREMTLQLVAVSRDKSSSDFNKRLQRQKRAARKQQPRRPDVSDMNVEY